MAKNDDGYGREWIIQTGVPIVESYNGEITVRALHYRLVSAGMPNTIQHYGRVKSAMTKARWDGLLGFDSFVDHERGLIGQTEYQETDLDSEIESTKNTIEYWMENFNKNRWENQDIYPEVWVEKKALQSVFQRPANAHDVALFPCKGYPSLTHQYKAAQRIREASSKEKECVILYFGDYDPSGEDIPRSIAETLYKMGCDVQVRRIALMEEQVVSMGLPPAPTKRTDSRSVHWDGLGQVELDAIEPRQLASMCEEAILEVFDEDKYEELQETEEEETIEYKRQLKEYVIELAEEGDDEDED